MFIITIILRTIFSIIWLGGLVMTGIGGWYDYQQTLAMPLGPLGLSIFLYGIILYVIGSLAIIAQLWYKLRTSESLKVKVEVYPNSTVGRDITLIVHNKGTISAEFSATMTPTFDYIEPNAKGVKIQGLMNIAMVWEASGTANEPINPDGKKLLKLCSVHEQLLVGKAMHYMRFYKVESSKLQSFECGNYTDGDAIPKVRVNIQIDSNMNVKGQRTWVYEIKYINDGTMLTIVPLEELRRKSLIRKVLRLNKF